MYSSANLAALPRLTELAPQAFAGFKAFDDAVFRPGHLDARTKELIAVAVALTTQCPYCIDVHAARARDAGATAAEIAEAALVAAAIRAGGAITHATHALGAPKAG